MIVCWNLSHKMSELSTTYIYIITNIHIHILFTVHVYAITIVTVLYQMLKSLRLVLHYIFPVYLHRLKNVRWTSDQCGRWTDLELISILNLISIDDVWWNEIRWYFISYRLKNTPMLLAASSGALEAVCCLIELGADILRTNEKHHNLIHLAALRFHTNILDFFISHEHPGVSVWNVLVCKLK